MKDIARKAGVSTSTVSHVINKNRYVSDAIRSRVELAIAELKYTPSALARSFKRQETKTIGMLVTRSNNPFFSEIVQGVERGCYEVGYQLVLCHTENNKQRMLNNIANLLERRVDGLLVLCSETHTIPEDIFTSLPDLPMVVMDWMPFSGTCDIIRDNSWLGALMAVNHLVSQGHTKIAIITGPQNNSQALPRLQGYHHAMEQNGLLPCPEYQIEGSFEFESGYKAAQQLLMLNEPPEAIFCGNDAMAIGAYRAVYEVQRIVGQDIALIGYDDIELAQYVCPPLTTIHQPKDELGQLAIETLLYRIQNKQSKPRILTLTPYLVERASSMKQSNRAI